MPFKLETYIGTFEWIKGEQKPISVKSPDIKDAKGNVIQQGTENHVLNNIVSLTASGEELVMINEKFTWIPNVKHESNVTWRGTWAEFIYENL